MESIENVVKRVFDDFMDDPNSPFTNCKFLSNELLVSKEDIIIKKKHKGIVTRGNMGFLKEKIIRELKIRKEGRIQKMTKKRKKLEVEDLEQKAKMEYSIEGSKPCVNDILIKLDEKVRSLEYEGYEIEGFECWRDRKETTIKVYGIK